MTFTVPAVLIIAPALAAAMMIIPAVTVVRSFAQDGNNARPCRKNALYGTEVVRFTCHRQYTPPPPWRRRRRRCPITGPASSLSHCCPSFSALSLASGPDESTLEPDEDEKNAINSSSQREGERVEVWYMIGDEDAAMVYLATGAYNRS